MRSEYKTAVGVILLVTLLVISLPFEKKYNDLMCVAAQDQSTRLLAGLVLLYLSYHDIVLGALMFITLFLWMSDIQLLSSLRMYA